MVPKCQRLLWCLSPYFTLLTQFNTLRENHFSDSFHRIPVCSSNSNLVLLRPIHDMSSFKSFYMMFIKLLHLKFIVTYLSIYNGLYWNFTWQSKYPKNWNKENSVYKSSDINFIVISFWKGCLSQDPMHVY